MSGNVIKVMIFVGIALILLILVSRTTSKIFKKTKKLHVRFFGSLIEMIIIVSAIVSVLNLFPAYQRFSDTILTSSSLLVVVLGFAFQTSLSDVIAGIFISLFSPFEVNDRVTLKSQNITGVVENITIRHTVIRTFTNSRLVVPNHIANEEIVENNHIKDMRSSNFIDVMVDYNCDLEKAKNIIQKCIEEHPKTINPKCNGDKGYTYVYTRELADDGICLRASAWTQTVDINFKACSEIRDNILKEFKRNNIKIPYHYTEVITKEPSN